MYQVVLHWTVDKLLNYVKTVLLKKNDENHFLVKRIFIVNYTKYGEVKKWQRTHFNNALYNMHDASTKIKMYKEDSS